VPLPVTTDNSQADGATAVDLQADPADRPQAARKTKSRVMLNFWLDALLLVNVVFIAWVSALIYIVFPAPTKADGWVLWGRTFDQWHDIQSTALCVCGLLAIEHIVLHWNWVCCTIAARILHSRNRPDESVQAVYGVGTFICVLIIVFSGVVAGTFCVQQPR
jgi:hypothetical protein